MPTGYEVGMYRDIGRVADALEEIAGSLAKIANPPQAVLRGTGLATVRDEIKAALEGDSNDDEHDALAAVAEVLGVSWRPPDA
jgi:hypothetical protein